MIKCLIIGTQKSVNSYAKKAESIPFFSLVEKQIIEEHTPIVPFINLNRYDAFLFVQNPPQITPFIEKAMKHQCNIYFTDQSWINAQICSEWLKINAEANNLFFIEVPEILHPMTQDFLLSYNRNSTIEYLQSIVSNSQIRPILLNALSIFSLINPFQVKQIDINSMGTTSNGKPVIKIRLKMHDHSFAHIKLRLKSKEEHTLKIENNKGLFYFNYNEGYLQNSHGSRFVNDIIPPQHLTSINLESFAFQIIQNKKPAFTLFQYQSVLKILDTIQNILVQNF